MSKCHVLRNTPQTLFYQVTLGFRPSRTSGLKFMEIKREKQRHGIRKAAPQDFSSGRALAGGPALWVNSDNAVRRPAHRWQAPAHCWEAAADPVSVAAASGAADSWRELQKSFPSVNSQDRRRPGQPPGFLDSLILILGSPSWISTLDSEESDLDCLISILKPWIPWSQFSNLHLVGSDLDSPVSR